ncbi:uncharacterized protein ATNIH1004_011536 [Aspergillus tanneri]|uniref:Uncharacterized protein n=1 Tax=Aspergillus tanneri TaxID=1220188 RepID=A0A5M9M761_9EURO|nr:uncharacterized protein ATNIH1004_011536 [Aspergillus tanneri]KAA8642591.1 hypothetical protein ATNIH1004_011536 [Aspergillus tanneri]
METSSTRTWGVDGNPDYPVGETRLVSPTPIFENQVGTMGNPILIDIVDPRADIEGGTIPETLSNASWSPICAGEGSNHHGYQDPDLSVDGRSAGSLEIQEGTTYSPILINSVSPRAHTEGDTIPESLSIPHRAPSLPSRCTTKGCTQASTVDVHDTSGSPSYSQNGREHLPNVEKVNGSAKADVQIQTIYNPSHSLSRLIQSLKNTKTDSIRSCIAHRPSQDGMEFLCIKLQWYSHAELGQLAPDLLNEYIHEQGLHELTGAPKKRATPPEPRRSSREKRRRTRYSPSI